MRKARLGRRKTRAAQTDARTYRETHRDGLTHTLTRTHTHKYTTHTHAHTPACPSKEPDVVLARSQTQRLKSAESLKLTPNVRVQVPQACDMQARGQAQARHKFAHKRARRAAQTRIVAALVDGPVRRHAVECETMAECTGTAQAGENRVLVLQPWPKEALVALAQPMGLVPQSPFAEQRAMEMKQPCPRAR